MSNSTPTNKTIDSILEGWKMIVMSEYDGTSFVKEELDRIEEAKLALLTYIKEEVINTTIPVEYDDPIETPHILNRLRESQRNRLEQS
jgi:hypothetical protein